MTRLAAPALACLVALAALLAACGDIERLPRQVNERPLAALAVTTFAVLGEAVVADASGSTDPDGTIVEYRFNFGDVDEILVTAEPMVEHVYREPGDYTVTVTVVDDRGGKAADAAPVSVR